MCARGPLEHQEDVTLMEDKILGDGGAEPFDPREIPWPGKAADAFADRHETFEVLGVNVTKVPLTDMERRVTFRALRVTALLVEMGAEWAEAGMDADAMRRLARVYLPEGVGVELEDGE